jgi:hypothetical protein
MARRPRLKPELQHCCQDFSLTYASSNSATLAVKP